jgi:hypothetical protein
MDTNPKPRKLYNKLIPLEQDPEYAAYGNQINANMHEYLSKLKKTRAGHVKTPVTPTKQ